MWLWKLTYSAGKLFSSIIFPLTQRFPREIGTYVHQKTITRMFIAINIPNVSQQQDRYKLWYIHVKYYMAIKMNKLYSTIANTTM